MARRHQQALAGGCNRDRCGEVSVVSLLFHHGDQDGTERRGVSSSGAGDPTEEVGCHDIHHGHATGHPADQGIGQVDQFLGNAAASHQTAHGDEERNCHQGEGTDTLDHHLAQECQIRTVGQHATDGSDGHGICDREPKEDQEQESAQQNGDCKTRIHTQTPPSATCSSRLVSFSTYTFLPSSRRILFTSDSSSKITMAIPATGIGIYMTFLLSQGRLG